MFTILHYFYQPTAGQRNYFTNSTTVLYYYGPLLAILSLTGNTNTLLHCCF